MKIKTAEFIISNTDYKKSPVTKLPEYAFIGRSNVGKSSLINMLTGRKNLAKTSSKPGKTQLINHFLINQNWYLVDLPGYGWAKVSKSAKASWGKMTEDYIINRSNLSCLFILIDSRIPPQQIDLDFISWAGQNAIPLALVMTKCDKQSKNKTQATISQFRKALKQDWEELPPIILSSSANSLGKEEILSFVETANNSFNQTR